MIKVKLTNSCLIFQEDGLRQVLQEMEALFEQNQTDVWGFKLLEVIFVMCAVQSIPTMGHPILEEFVLIVSHDKCKNVLKQTWRELYFPFNQ